MAELDTWQAVVLNDCQLWTHVQLPSFIVDNEFLRLIRKVREHVEQLDCSRCTQLTQDVFLTLSRQPVIVLPRLRSLLVPSELVLPDAVFEALAGAGCLPVVEEIGNIQAKSSVCIPLRCQAYFKKSHLTVLNDCPMASYGRARHLLVPDSVEVKQRRQRWDADLAKVAICCPTIDTYRCSRGVGYIDDKSIERISVLFPRLRSVHLQLCSVSDEGLARFFSHNNTSSTRSSSSSSSGTGSSVHGGDSVQGLLKLVLDRPGDVTDKGLRTVADSCQSLSQLSLCRCPVITVTGFRYLVTQCRHLTVLYLSAVQCLDDVTLALLGDSCQQLTSLQLYDTSSFTSRGIDHVTSRCTQLNTLTLHNCAEVDDLCLESIAKNCHVLLSVSLGVGCSVLVTPRAVINLIMRCHTLDRVTFEGNQHFKVPDVRQSAEQTYILLSNDVTCRSSLIRSLVLINVDANFVQLLTVLCSQLDSLDLRQVQDSDNWSIVMSQVITDCSQLKTLDLSSVEIDEEDEFLFALCQHALELRHFSVTLGPHVNTRDFLEVVIQTTPSLSSLHVTVNVTSTTDSDAIDEQFLTQIITRYHGSAVYCNTVKQTSSKNSCRHYEMSFTPLKFLTAGSVTADL